MTANVAIYVDSRDFYLKYNSSDVSANVRDHSVPAEWKYNDITTYGSLGMRYGKSIDVTTFTVTFLFNQVATTGTQTVVGAAWYAGTLAPFEMGPAGTASSNTKVTGNAYCTKYELIGKAGDAQTVKAEFKVDNALTFATY